MVADGDVVGVAVESVLAEGENDLGFEAADLEDQASNDLVLIGLNEGVGMMVVVPAGHAGIAVAEHVVGLDAELLDGLGEFGAADLTDGLAGGRAGLADFAEFAGRGGYEAGGDAAGGVHGDGAADGESFVVGVGEEDEEAMVRHG